MRNKRAWIDRLKGARRAAGALAAAGVLTLLAGTGILGRVESAAADGWYQKREASDGQIVLVGVDQQAIEEWGPYQQWGREVLAKTLDALNQSKDCRPAAIGVDILFTGETQKEADAALTEAAGRYGNVVLACLGEYGTPLLPKADGEYELGEFSVVAVEEPYEELKSAAGQGHINAMLDTDGLLRHHLLYLQLMDGGRIPSLALAVTQMYGKSQGIEEITLPPVNGRGFWYLPFCGIPGDFPKVSIAQVLSGEVPASYFSGKIVLIGPYAPGLQDSYLTAADHAQSMYGVEYQANAVQALLWGNYKTEAPDTIQIALLFFVLLAGIAGFWRRPVWSATLLWVVLWGGWLLLCRWLYDRGWVVHVLWIPVGITILFAGCLAVNYIQASRQRRQVTNTFQRYVAPEIVGELLKEGTNALGLGGKLSTIAVLFVDVRGFTALSERLSPEKVVTILNRYLSLFADCILKNGGTLDKFVGDQAMAFWGEPLHQEDYIMKAAQAAIDMVNGSKALGEELLAQYGQRVSFGIGIHLGEAVVGNIGSPQRMDYTAIGDTVNTAARLEANAPGDTIYISRAVADALKGRVRVVSLGGSVRLKGKREGFEVLVLEGLSEETEKGSLQKS